MGDYAIEFDRVWKKFRKGEDYDSLRDFVPSLVRRVFSRGPAPELREREFWALNDVSFGVRKGEAVAIVGRNGSGTSTSLKLISGILRPNRGRVHLEGRLGALIEVGAGFHLDLTGRENVYLNGTILGLSRKEIDASFDSIVDFAELQEFIDTPVKRYSSGMYARLGFAVAAHMRLDVLLVDEVLAVGDIAFQQKCVNRIKELKANGTTIVFISHNMQAVLDVCSRVVLLERGVKTMDGPAAEVVAAYLDRSTQHRHADVPAGDGQVVVRRFSLLDANGNERTSFQPGQKFKIRVTVEARTPIPQPVIGLAFYASDGTCLYGHNTSIDHWEAGELHGVAEFEVDYDSVHLYPGRYLVSFAVQDAFFTHDYLYEDRAYSFTVDGTVAPGIGVVQWPHRWHRAGEAAPTDLVHGQPDAGGAS